MKRKKSNLINTVHLTPTDVTQFNIQLLEKNITDSFCHAVDAVLATGEIGIHVAIMIAMEVLVMPRVEAVIRSVNAS